MSVWWFFGPAGDLLQLEVVVVLIVKLNRGSIFCDFGHVTFDYNELRLMQLGRPLGFQKLHFIFRKGV